MQKHVPPSYVIFLLLLPPPPPPPRRKRPMRTTAASFLRFLDHKIYTHLYTCSCGPGQISRYSNWLRAGRSGIESKGAKFFAPVQTGPVAYPSSYKTRSGSFPGVKRLGLDVNHPFPSGSEVKERVELYIFSPCGPLWSVLGRTLPFLLLHINVFIFHYLYHLYKMYHSWWMYFQVLDVSTQGMNMRIKQ